VTVGSLVVLFHSGYSYPSWNGAVRYPVMVISPTASNTRMVACLKPEDATPDPILPVTNPVRYACSTKGGSMSVANSAKGMLCWLNDPRIVLIKPMNITVEKSSMPAPM